MTKKHSFKCSISVVIREIQIKTTLRFHLIQARMTKIQTTNDQKNVGTDVEKGELLFPDDESENSVQPLWKLL